MNSFNPQYSVASRDSLSVRIAARVRSKMFEGFMREFSPAPSETVLDIGVTSDQSYLSSNYFEMLYPHKERITAAGIDDASFLESTYPGLRFVHADARDLPFENDAFDLVHASAVIEHVGSLEEQARMISECARVSRRGIYLTTPNRWFPIEFHTLLPLVHWLPKQAYRAILQRTGYEFFAREENLNLLTHADLAMAAGYRNGWRFHVTGARLFGWTSNLILVGHK